MYLLRSWSDPRMDMIMKRSELAQATGCNLETVRYYENIGVMPPPRRSENGYRVYEEEDRKRLNRFLEE